jgi:hypothetical protein
MGMTGSVLKTKEQKSFIRDIVTGQQAKLTGTWL